MPGPPSPLTGAERQARYRVLQEGGVQVVPVKVGHLETEMLIDAGWLIVDDLDDRVAVGAAIARMLEAAAFAPGRGDTLLPTTNRRG